jgi:membrane protein DedA with SNARE-associated domain
MHFAQDVAHSIEPYLRSYGVWAIFVILYFESFGAPLPGESALIASSLLARHGDIALLPLFLLAWAGAVLGDSTGYVIGRVGGRPLLLRYGHLVGLTPERLARLEDLVRRHGALIVAFARFVVVLRQLNGLVAGSMRMPWPHFVLANTIGGALWTAVWVLGPYYFAEFFAWTGALERIRP